MEWPDALYHKLNAALRNKCRESLYIWFSYLKLFLTALFKLPDVEGEVLWRGIKKKFEDYKSGTHVAWWAFSSCTQSLGVLESSTYLGTSNTRTLFSIQAYNGKNIRNHSYYQNEDEILLLPGTYFQVIDQINPSPDLHIVQLKQVEPEQKLLGEPFKLKKSPPISAPVVRLHGYPTIIKNVDGKLFTVNFIEISALAPLTQIIFRGLIGGEKMHKKIVDIKKFMLTKVDLNWNGIDVLELASAHGFAVHSMNTGIVDASSMTTFQENKNKNSSSLERKITFASLSRPEERHDDVPIPYAGFIWSNMTYMDQKYCYRFEPHLVPLFDRYIVVAFTVRLHGYPTIIKNVDGKLFTVNFIEISALAPLTQIIFRGLIGGEKMHKKIVDIKKFMLTKVDLNWNGIDVLELASAHGFAVHSMAVGNVNSA
ncbi:unnamed protein product [Rotaria magnacalcarata]|uniref:NAD(P)(+)--arginine ADP-ribosyltransferase n=1 Tax=Rotaria magnacalcarata TaxID=392030 RepID=A0A820BS69_9BILA|nr:unnamed protein product [Rotaria magnacalcarata]